MAILWPLLLSLLFGSAAWAAGPPEAAPEQPGPVPAPGPSPGAQPPLSQKQQLRDLDRRLQVIESMMVGRGHGRGLLERGLGWSPELKERGFFLYSTDGNYRLHLNGGIQVDYRAFPFGQNGADPGTEPSGFDVRRLRPILDFRIAKHFRGQLMPDLTRNEPLFNAFVEWDQLEWARVRVGQFKPVFSVENQQGEFDLVFAERSLVQNFALRRTFGVQVTGRVIRRQLRYDAGVFNSNNGSIGNQSRPAPSADSNKLGMARVMATPFLLRGPQAFRKLDVGIGVLFGDCIQSACQQPMLTMGQDRIILQYNSPVTGNGMHTWLMPQMTWFWGRLGMMSTLIHTWEPKINHATGQTAFLQNQAWMVQAEFALTDDEPAFNRITPKRPLDFSKNGAWGALSVAARYSEQQVDPQVFGAGLADPSLYARAARGFSLALIWYASREFRMQWIWEHTDLFGGTPAFSTSPSTDMLLTRFTLIY